MAKTYTPGWVLEGRTPSFVNQGGLPKTFGVIQYLWGNMPALDILNIKDNEGLDDVHRDVPLLFAASGDIINVVKTVVNIPKGNDG